GAAGCAPPSPRWSCRPCRRRLRLQEFVSAFVSSLSRGPLLTQKRGDARDGLPDLVDAMGLFHLAGCGLETQVELFLLELEQLVGQLVGGHGPEVANLGHAACSMWTTPASTRVTTLVRTGSFA